MGQIGIVIYVRKVNKYNIQTTYIHITIVVYYKSIINNIFSIYYVKATFLFIYLLRISNPQIRSSLVEWCCYCLPY